MKGLCLKKVIGYLIHHLALKVGNTALIAIKYHKLAYTFTYFVLILFEIFICWKIDNQTQVT